MNYSELRASISEWTHRADLDAPADVFIALAEERLRGVLRLNRLTATTTLTITAGSSTVALPADYLEGRSVTGGGWDWTLSTPQQLQRAAESGGQEHSYAVFGGELAIPYEASEDLEVVLCYYQQLPALGLTASTNWVVEHYPGVYLWHALAEAALYAGNEAKRQVYESRAAQALDALRQADASEAYFAAALRPDYSEV